MYIAPLAILSAICFVFTIATASYAMLSFFLGVVFGNSSDLKNASMMLVVSTLVCLLSILFDVLNNAI